MTRSANQPQVTTHTTFVAAPPAAVYDLIADVDRWPYLFEPTVHVERLYRGATDERLRLWAVGNGAIRNWISRRTLDRAELRIRFEQEMPAPPLASMSGEWVFIPIPDYGTSVVLLHEFRAVGDDPYNVALVTQAVDRTSTAELAALRRVAELGDRRSALVQSFADSVTIDCDAGPVYDFLYRVQDWPSRLSHVTRVVLDEAVPNLQTVEMDTETPDGRAHRTRLVRVCSPYESIAYKQTLLPEILAAHVGRWRVYPVATGVRVTSHQTVLINPQMVCQALGPETSLQRAKELVRQVLSRNSMITLLQAKQAIEGRPVDDPYGITDAALDALPLIAAPRTPDSPRLGPVDMVPTEAPPRLP